MSQTLGEKLRQAREERGISLSEVAEQTRISPHYLESIENDDYRPLPGGIFNKGFIKSYAKYVELDEQEALQDYTQAISANESRDDMDLKVYKPEVLTDDRAGASMIPTVIWAVVILGLMSAGIWFGVNYIRNRSSASSEESANTSNAANTAVANAKPTAAPAGAVPDMSSLKVEFSALKEPVSLSATTDGKMSIDVVNPGAAKTFEPKESLKLSYYRSYASIVELKVNGKQITLPAQPLNPKKSTIEFEINKDNLAQIWQSAAISTDVPGAVIDTSATPSTTGPILPPQPRQTPVTRPSTAVNNAGTNTAVPKPGETPRPAATPRPQPTKATPTNKIQ